MTMSNTVGGRILDLASADGHSENDGRAIIPGDDQRNRQRVDQGN